MATATSFEVRSFEALSYFTLRDHSLMFLHCGKIKYLPIKANFINVSFLSNDEKISCSFETKDFVLVEVQKPELCGG